MAEPVHVEAALREGATEERTVSLLDIVAVLARRKWFVAGFTTVVVVVVLAALLLSKYLPQDHFLNRFPDLYTPQVAVLIQEGSRTSDTLSQFLDQSGLGGISGLLGGAGTQGSGAELAQYLLESDEVRDAIAEEFDFVARYEYLKNPRTSSRERVETSLEFEYAAGPSVLTVKYTDTDKQLATDVVNWTVGHLEGYFRALNESRAREKLRDLEERLATAETEMKTAKQALVDFAVRNGIVDIETQAAGAAESLAEYRKQRVSLEFDLNNLLKSGRGADDQQVLRLQSDIAELGRLIDEAERGWSTYRPSSIPVSDWPRIASQYLDLKDTVTFRQGIYTLLLQSYETVRQEELDQTTIFRVLRAAEVPEIKSKPSRSRILVVAAVSAFLLAVFVSFVAEYIARARRDPEESRKLAEIRESMRLRKTARPVGRERP